MSALDSLAGRARAASERLAGQGGLKGRLAGELAEDAELLRKLKPELIKKRTNRSAGGGPNPFLVIGAALVAGVALAKWLDWRGHAYPRR